MNIFLSIIRFNKLLQNKLNISIDAYKNISGVYRVKDKNGLYKYYTIDEDNLLFEGECMNGKKNGKGKEYYITDSFNYEKKYEGNYLNGKRHGKGKEYTVDFELLFEGEYLNGKRWNGKLYDEETTYIIKNGNGKVFEYNIYGKIEFSGIILNGKYSGYKYIYKQKFLKYAEYYENDLKSDIIEEYDDYNKIDGVVRLRYKGQFLNGKRHGIGMEFSCENRKIIFKGEYMDGKRWNGNIYDSEKGDILYTIKNGNGYIKENQLDFLFEFEGNLINGERNGNVKEYYKKKDDSY